MWKLRNVLNHNDFSYKTFGCRKLNLLSVSFFYLEIPEGLFWPSTFKSYKILSISSEHATLYIDVGQTFLLPCPNVIDLNQWCHYNKSRQYF